MFLSQIIIYAVSAYLAIGFLFSIYFSFFAVGKFDESAKNSGVGFRLIIFFGVAAFWVWLLIRMLRGSDQPHEITAHRPAAGQN